MALMEFMKLMEPAQLMEGLIFIELIYLIKLMEPMKTIGYRCFLAALAALYLHMWVIDSPLFRVIDANSFFQCKFYRVSNGRLEHNGPKPQENLGQLSQFLSCFSFDVMNANQIRKAWNSLWVKLSLRHRQGSDRRCPEIALISTTSM